MWFGFAKGNTITIAKADVGTSTDNITKVENISEGDKVQVHQGYQEILQLKFRKATIEVSLELCS